MAFQQILKLGAASTSVSSYSYGFRVFTSRFLLFPKSSANWASACRHEPVRSFASLKSEKVQVKRKKKRLDEVCVEKYEQYSRSIIQSWIIQGKVFVDGKVVNKCGTLISDKVDVDIKAEEPKYVCRGGDKLEAAIELLEIDISGKVALDSGLSTGGFTDCLLQYGASFVYGVDVGYGQVADKIRKDERVSVIERTNVRYLTELPQKVDLVTLDLSFISILMVIPAVMKVMKNDGMLVTLIKPQFEARRNQVGGGGIVRDPLVHQEVLDRIVNGVQDFGFECKGWIESPLKGAAGNKEFLACFSRREIQSDGDLPIAKADIDKLFRGQQLSEDSTITED